MAAQAFTQMEHSEPVILQGGNLTSLSYGHSWACISAGQGMHVIRKFDGPEWGGQDRRIILDHRDHHEVHTHQDGDSVEGQVGEHIEQVCTLLIAHIMSDHIHQATPAMGSCGRFADDNIRGAGGREKPGPVRASGSPLC